MQYGKGTSGGVATGTVNGNTIAQIPIFELAATNLLLQSAAFDNASWVTVGGIVVTADTNLAPNGVVEADTINDNSAANTGERNQTVAVANDAVTRTFSLFVTAGTSTGSRVGVRLTGGVALDSFVDFNPSSGVVNNSSGASILYALVINGVTWYRVACTVVNNLSGNVNAVCYIQPASLNVGATGTIIVWGGQLEVGAAPSSQIPTYTVAVARTAGKIPLYALDPNAHGAQTFIANGNFTVPDGVSVVYITGAAGGGGGGGSAATGVGGGGGGGQSTIKQAVVVTPGQVIAVTIGQGGNGGAIGNNNGAVGTDTIFAATAPVTLTHGNGGTGGAAGVAGNGGAAGGTTAGQGQNGPLSVGCGGAGAGNQLATVAFNTAANTTGQNGASAGGGGGGGGGNGGAGGNGANGVLIVEW